jgi:hypothetical protein
MPRVLWCLTIARWIVATVVAAVAATVLLLVLTVGLRSETVSVSVNHGHFQVATSLWSTQEFNLIHYPDDRQTRAALPPDRYRTDTLAVYRRANHVDIWVSMDFQTPGCNGIPRRSGFVVSSNVTTVSVFDMPNAPSFLGMVRIGTVNVHREVCHFYHGVLDRWIRVNNKDTLDYIAKTYGGRSEFTAMLQVNTTTAIKDDTTMTGVETTYHSDTHYCWPVTIGHSRSITAEKITCKHSRGIDYTAGSGDLWVPPPPPDNSPPPPQICELCGQN